MGNRSFVFQLLVMMALSGCTLLPEQPPLSKRHDFGPPPLPQQKRVTPVGLLLIDVQMPAWLETTEIQYRLLYDDPTRLRAYAQNQWIAPPAALLEQRWREALSGDTAVSLYRLEAALDRFEQVFDAPDSAYAVIGLRAVLVRPDQSAVVAERRFTIRRACPPHVQGAIDALASLADSTLEDVLRWAIQVDQLIRANPIPDESTR